MTIITLFDAIPGALSRRDAPLPASSERAAQRFAEIGVHMIGVLFHGASQLRLIADWYSAHVRTIGASPRAARPALWLY